jgi:Ser/Thr protein kinase RdoA (MazF antagonist)
MQEISLDQNEFFYKLTPEIILKSVENEGYPVTGVFWKLNSLENRVYDIELENKSHIIVKFYRPGRWNKNQILEEHEFLSDLAENEIPVCSPLKFDGGGTIKQIENIFFSVWERTGGRCMDEFSNDQLAVLGRLLGRIHMTGKKKETGYRLRLTSDNLCKKPLEFLIRNSMIPKNLEKEYVNAVNRISDIFDQRSKDVPYHRIHGDCHIGNLLYGNDGFFFLDFDDFYSGPAIQDFWMLLSGNGINTVDELRILIENYSLFSDFNEKWLDLIEPLRALRFVNYAGWIAKRWEDPAFKNAFPHFGTEFYWQQETKDLEDQLNIIENTKFVLNDDHIEKTVENEIPLSNKDFFWDWDK